MNFDFIKHIEGLNKAYPFCANAEELAVSKPDLSMISSRKSAEQLTKFVYLIAHSEEADYLSFSDMLSDPVLKRYLNNESLLNALHFIRKKGNTAVHTDNVDSPETAVAVLSNLHYTLGEVAKRMGLITKYPSFDSNIAPNPFAELLEMDEDNLYRKMYDEHLLAKNRAKKLYEEYLALCAPIKIVPGDIELKEILEFHSKPSQEAVLKIQEHFGFLAVKALKYLSGEDEKRQIDFAAELTLYGKETVTTTGLPEFMETLMNRLPDAEGFKISSSYFGPNYFSPNINSWPDSDVKEPFFSVVEMFEADKNFSYIAFEFFYNSGEVGFSKYENGKWVNLKSQYSEDIINHEFDQNLWTYNLDLSVDFDFEKYPHILAALQDTVRKHIPKEELGYCEDSWEFGDLNILVSSISWNLRKLRVVQDFLDEINAILLPIKQECECYALGEWYQLNEPFAVATWDWTEDGFKVKGCNL